MESLFAGHFPKLNILISTSIYENIEVFWFCFESIPVICRRWCTCISSCAIFLASALVLRWLNEETRLFANFYIWPPEKNPNRKWLIHPSHKSNIEAEKYPTMYHFVTEMCTHVHIFVKNWCIVGYGTGALWVCATGQLTTPQLKKGLLWCMDVSLQSGNPICWKIYPPRHNFAAINRLKWKGQLFR